MCKDAQLEKEEEIRKLIRSAATDEPHSPEGDDESILHELCKKVRAVSS